MSRMLDPRWVSSSFFLFFCIIPLLAGENATPRCHGSLLEANTVRKKKALDPGTRIHVYDYDIIPPQERERERETSK